MSLGLWGTFIAYPVAKHNNFENPQFRPLHKTNPANRAPVAIDMFVGVKHS
jgi:hypothetical protein